MLRSVWLWLMLRGVSVVGVNVEVSVVGVNVERCQCGGG